MFSGIVETIAIITGIKNINGCKYFSLSPKFAFDDLALGQSIAINGACLTITEFNESHFKVTAVPETLKRTNLDALRIGDRVNLERSLTINARIHGHYVQGHIDTQGQIIEREMDGDAILTKVNLLPQYAKYLVAKGYIAIDGMSTTLIEAEKEWFSVMFIPYTRQITIASQYQVGSIVNLEVDILGKYIEKLVGVYCHA